MGAGVDVCGYCDGAKSKKQLTYHYTLKAYICDECNGIIACQNGNFRKYRDKESKDVI